MFPSWDFQLNVDFEYEIESSQGTFSPTESNSFTSSSEEDGKLVICEEKEKIFAQNFQVSLLLFLECVSQVSSEALWRKYDEMHENSSSIKRLNISE